MKKIFFMLSLFLGVILAGCAELESFLTSMTFFPAITQDPSQTKPQSPTTQNNEFLEDEAIIKKALETLDKIYIPEEIKHYDFSSYELFNVVLNDNIEIEISNFNGMGKLYFDIYGVVYPNNSSDYVFKLELYSFEQQDISFEMKVSYKDEVILNRSYNIKVNYNGSYEEDDYKLKEEALNTFKNIYIPDMLNTNILNNEIINVMLPNNYKLDVNLIKGDTNISFSGYSTSNPNYSYHILSFDLYHLEEQTLVFELQLIYNGKKIDSSNYQIYVNHKSSDESDVISIKDAKNRIDEVVTVRGTVNYVSSINGGSFRAFLVDDYGQSLMMFRIPEEYINIVYLYSTIKVTATITIYNGQYELLNYENIENDYSIGQYIHPELYMHEDSCEYEYFKDVQNVPVTLEGNFKLEYDSATKLYQLVDKYYRVIILYASKNYTINYSGFISDINNHLGSSVTKIYGYMTWYQDSPELILTDNSFIEFGTNDNTLDEYYNNLNDYFNNNYYNYNQSNIDYAKELIEMFYNYAIDFNDNYQIENLYNQIYEKLNKLPNQSNLEKEYYGLVDNIPADDNLEGLYFDNQIMVITESGKKLREVTNVNTYEYKWIGTGFNFYVVFDNEGRICYAVNQPDNGFGAPSDSTYYYNPYYSNDYTKNPAFNILENYEPYNGMSLNFQLYEVVVPEGGFALIASGTGSNRLASFLTNGKITNPNDDKINNYEFRINAEKPYREDVYYSYNFKHAQVIALLNGNEPEVDLNYTNFIISECALNNNWEKGIIYNPVIIDEYSTMEVNATPVGTFGQNSGKYYNSDETWRIYQNESPTVTNNTTRKIEKISIEYISYKEGIIEAYAVWQESGAILYVYDNTFNFRVINKSDLTNGQVRITGVKIWYEEKSNIEFSTVNGENYVLINIRDYYDVNNVNEDNIPKTYDFLKDVLASDSGAPAIVEVINPFEIRKVGVYVVTFKVTGMYETKEFNVTYVVKDKFVWWTSMTVGEYSTLKQQGYNHQSHNIFTQNAWTINKDRIHTYDYLYFLDYYNQYKDNLPNISNGVLMVFDYNNQLKLFRGATHGGTSLAYEIYEDGKVVSELDGLGWSLYENGGMLNGIGEFVESLEYGGYVVYIPRDTNLEFVYTYLLGAEHDNTVLNLETICYNPYDINVSLNFDIW